MTGISFLIFSSALLMQLNASAEVRASRGVKATTAADAQIEVTGACRIQFPKEIDFFTKYFVPENAGNMTPEFEQIAYKCKKGGRYAAEGDHTCLRLIGCFFKSELIGGKESFPPVCDPKLAHTGIIVLDKNQKAVDMLGIEYASHPSRQKQNETVRKKGKQTGSVGAHSVAAEPAGAFQSDKLKEFLCGPSDAPSLNASSYCFCEIKEEEVKELERKEKFCTNVTGFNRYVSIGRSTEDTVDGVIRSFSDSGTPRMRPDSKIPVIKPTSGASYTRIHTDNGVNQFLEAFDSAGKSLGSSDAKGTVSTTAGTLKVLTNVVQSAKEQIKKGECATALKQHL